MSELTSELKFKWAVVRNAEGRTELRCTSSQPDNGLRYQVVCETYTPVGGHHPLADVVADCIRSHRTAWSEAVLDV